MQPPPCSRFPNYIDTFVRKDVPRKQEVEASPELPPTFSVHLVTLLCQRIDFGFPTEATADSWASCSESINPDSSFCPSTCQSTTKFHNKLFVVIKEQELAKLELPLGRLPAKILELLPAALESMS